MAKRDDRRIIIISAAIFIIALLYCLKFFFDSYRAVSKKASAELELARLQKEAWGLESNFSKINNVLSATVSAPKLMDRVQEIARQNNVKLDSIEPQDAARQAL